MRRNGRVLAVGIATLLLFGSSEARGATPQSLADDIREQAARGADPVTSVLVAFAEAGDFHFDSHQVDQLLSILGCPKNGFVEMLLGDLSGFEKRGNRITIRKNRGGTVGLGEPPRGFAHYGDTITFSLRKQGSGDSVKLDDFGGIKVSEKQDDTKADLRTMELLHNGNHRILRITAGILFFSRTMDVDLTDMFVGVENPFLERPASEPSPQPDAGAGEGAASVGIAALLGDRSVDQIMEDVLAGRDRFEMGDKGPAVEELQRLLREAGVEVVVDGDFGPSTKGAVEEFQRGHGLTVDGIAGKGTLRALMQR